MPNETRSTYFFYDRKTGAVVGSYVHFDVKKNAFVEQSASEVQKLTSGLVGGRPAEDIGIAHADLPLASSSNGYHVDPKSGQVRVRPRLRVESSKRVLKADGEDRVDLEITVAAEDGKPVPFDGELQVRAGRGRLSTPGGRVQAKGGRAKVSLTAARETVHRVNVRVVDPSGRCADGLVRLSFE